MTLKQIITHLATELKKKDFKPYYWTIRGGTPSKKEMYNYVEGHPEIAGFSINAGLEEYASILASKVKNPHVTINAVLNDPDGNGDTI